MGEGSELTLRTLGVSHAGPCDDVRSMASFSTFVQWSASGGPRWRGPWKTYCGHEVAEVATSRFRSVAGAIVGMRTAVSRAELLATVGVDERQVHGTSGAPKGVWITAIASVRTASVVAGARAA